MAFDNNVPLAANQIAADLAAINANWELVVPLSGNLGTPSAGDLQNCFPSNYFPDYNEADQGATGSGASAKAYIDTISTNSATLVFRHNSGTATTTYTFSISEVIPANINVAIEKGALLSRSSVAPSAVAFTGTGLNDATSGGLYTGSSAKSYRVEIDAAAAPDTFKWSNDAGVTWEATGVAVTGAAQTLEDDVTITFNVTTGHTLADRWDFTVDPIELTINGPFSAGLYQVFSGVGSVSFGGLIASAYPEWWGIDGTADDVQINAALDATAKVILQDKRYYIASSIYPNDNNSLCGKGKDVTYLDYSGGALGNQTGIIQVLNKDNVILRDFTLDGQSADGTVGTGSGIVIDNGSTNVELSNIHIYDVYRHAFIFNTGSNVHVNNLKVSYGCTSSAILIGQFPAAYGLAVNQDCTDAFFNNVIIEHVRSDGFGIWNCSGGDGYASVCKRINTDGLIVREFAKTILGYAYWGSGVTTIATDVNLNNFNFDNSGYASYALGDGRGLHIESGKRWNHNNGTILNLRKGDGSTSDGGYAITIAGGSELNYNNISIQNATMGVNSGVTSATDVNLNNINVKDSCYLSYNLSGVRFKLIGCTAYQLLAYTPFAMQIISTGGSVDNFIVDGFTAYVTHSTDSTYGITVLGTGTISNITIGKLNITADHGIAITNYLHRQYVHGIKQSFSLRETVAAATDYEVPIIVSGPDDGGRIAILNVYLSFGAGIAVDAINYNIYTLKKYNAAGGGATTIGSTTNTNSYNYSTAFVPVRYIIDSDNIDANLLVSEILTLAKTHAGTGKAEVDGILTIEYVNY